MKERVNVVGAAFEGRACKAAARERAQERARYDRLAAPARGRSDHEARDGRAHRAPPSPPAALQ